MENFEGFFYWHVYIILGIKNILSPFKISSICPIKIVRVSQRRSKASHEEKNPFKVFRENIFSH